MNAFQWSMTFKFSSDWIQTPDSKWMRSHGQHLPSELIFPFVPERQLSKQPREQTFHTYEQTRRQAGKRACAQTQLKRWEAELFLTPTRILLGFRFHSLVCTAAYSCHLCVHLCQLVCSARPVCVCGCFCSDDISVCFGESLFALWEMTPLVTLLFWFCFF